MSNKSNTQQNITEENKITNEPKPKGDLDDFIFSDEYIKHQSER